MFEDEDDYEYDEDYDADYIDDVYVDDDEYVDEDYMDEETGPILNIPVMTVGNPNPIKYIQPTTFTVGGTATGGPNMNQDPGIVYMPPQQEAQGLVMKPYNPMEHNEIIKNALEHKMDLPEHIAEGMYVPDRIYRYVPAVDGADPKIGKTDTQEEGYAAKKANAKAAKKQGNKTEGVVVTEPTEANLITSECTTGQHAPVIDFDIPIEVYPSSQLGHYHLYINKEISWEDYQKLLAVLADVGLIEQGYADASIEKGFSGVRPLGVVKVNAPRGVNVLIENARLRKFINTVTEENAYLKQKLDQDVNQQLVQERAQLVERVKELEKAIEEQNNLMATRVSWT